jgi:hypothetical protein
LARKLIAFFADERFVREIDAICRKIDISRSALIRRGLHYYIGMSELEMTAVDRKTILQAREAGYQ